MPRALSVLGESGGCRRRTTIPPQRPSATHNQSSLCRGSCELLHVQVGNAPREAVEVLDGDPALHLRLPLGLPFVSARDHMVSDVIARSGPVLNSTLKCATAWRRWVTISRTVLGSSPAVVGN